MRKAVLLVNTGTPAAPTAADVRCYLREFLSDPRVMDVPWPLRKLILELGILPWRPKHSAEAYKRVWTPDGSPLLAVSHRQMDAIQIRVELPVHLAMRYGEPSIRSIVKSLHQDHVQELFLIPMFPHYAMSSYETVVARTRALCRDISPRMRVDVMQPFFDAPGYIDSLVASAKPFLGDGFQKLLFSFHGIPVRHIYKSDASHAHCLCSKDCCHEAHPAHSTCYRHQCLRTAELFARRAGLESSQCAISFQSRLGQGAWLQPYTSELLKRFGREKVGTLLVITPSFVTDCLESLEEIAIGGKRIFQEAGGGELVLIPCMNDSSMFMDFLATQINEWQRAV